MTPAKATHVLCSACCAKHHATVVHPVGETCPSVRRCCHNRCALPVVEGTSRCEKHTAHHRADEKRKREGRRASGCCGVCERPAVPGKARCPRHDSSMGVYRCGRCGERGHNRATCTAARPERGR